MEPVFKKEGDKSKSAAMAKDSSIKSGSRADELTKQITSQRERLEKERKLAAGNVDYTKREYDKIKAQNEEGNLEQIKRRGFGDWLVGKTVGEGDYNQAVENQANINYRQRLEHQAYLDKASIEIHQKLDRASLAVTQKDYSKAQKLLTEISQADISFNLKRGQEERDKAMHAVSNANAGRISTSENWETGLQITDTVATVAAVGSGIGAMKAGASILTRGAMAAVNTFAIQSAHDVSNVATSAVSDIISGASPADRTVEAANQIANKTMDNLTTATLAGTGLGMAGKLSAAFSDTNQIVVAMTSRGLAGSIQSAGQEAYREGKDGQDLDIGKISMQAGFGLTVGAVGGASTEWGKVADEAKNLAIAGGTAILGTAVTTGIDAPNANEQMIKAFATQYLSTKVSQAIQKPTSPSSVSNIPSGEKQTQEKVATPAQTTRVPNSPPQDNQQRQTPLLPEASRTPLPTSDGIKATAPATLEQQARIRADEVTRLHIQIKEQELLARGRTISPEDSQRLAREAADIGRQTYQKVLNPGESNGSNTSKAPLPPAESKQSQQTTNTPTIDEIAAAESARVVAQSKALEFMRTHRGATSQQIQEQKALAFSEEFNRLRQVARDPNGTGEKVAVTDEKSGKTLTPQTTPPSNITQPQPKPGETPETLGERYRFWVEQTANVRAQKASAAAEQYLESKKLSNANYYRTAEQIELASKRAEQMAIDAELRRHGLPPDHSATRLEEAAMRFARDAGYHAFKKGVDSGHSENDINISTKKAYLDAYKAEKQKLALHEARNVSNTWYNKKLNEVRKATGSVSPSTIAELERSAKRMAAIAYDRHMTGKDASYAPISGSALPGLSPQAKQNISEEVGKLTFNQYMKRQLSDSPPERKIAHEHIVKGTPHPSKDASPEELAAYKGELARKATVESLTARNQLPLAQAERMAIERSKS